MTSVRPSSFSSMLGWLGIALLGIGSFVWIALSRGESVNAIWIVIASACVAALAYRFYSAWLCANVLMLDEQRATPACVHEDGHDYVRTDSWVVFGHHFAAIAGPGPLVGPVLASQFGYLPGTLWILIGGTLAGAVHDAVVMFCSIRRDGKSLGRMVRDEIGDFAGFIAITGILSILIILIAVLALVVVKALAESPWGLFTIMMTIPIAMAMGTTIQFGGHKRVGPATAAGVAALLLTVFLGRYLPQFPQLERALTLDGITLAWAVILYGLAASALPVWLLLAPRDYLSTFMKIGTVLILGFFIILLMPVLKMPALTKFIDGTGLVFAGPLFPFCFITIACGAISGFHALISSGTTPKLLTRESCVRTIGYGAMITEMLVAIMALIAACAMEPGIYFAINVKGEAAAVVAQVSAAGFPVTVEMMNQLAADIGEKTMIGRTGGAPTFAVGMALMFSGVIGKGAALPLWYHFAIMFEALFILTTIDAGTRVGRFLLQDLLGMITPALGQTGTWFSNIVSSVLFVSAWGWFLYQGVIDPMGGINSLWPIFGIANQLLAVIALSLATTVLIKMGKARHSWVTLAPLSWLFVVTMTAGWMKIMSSDPKLGFIAAIRGLSEKISAGGTPEQIGQWRRLLFNNQVDTVVTALFMLLVFTILVVCMHEWWLLMSGRKRVELRESPYMALSAIPVRGTCETI
ncbi:MAG: carbon starvation protein A [Candidatus Riflebacteria bacterium]|nr:carbon starvation protein A [Candidatus Riflebacteria bacterium]